ncbi:hypothetical protein [Xanthomonas albilineans]|uniref:hypothetical protein n=1 Tax=Xanthomonas albilineans TaxID=29447 RepID=UPI0012D448AB|nr:hypothetical protein [Xanthomonas albilineans]
MASFLFQPPSKYSLDGDEMPADPNIQLFPQYRTAEVVDTSIDRLSTSVLAIARPNQFIVSMLSLGGTTPVVALASCINNEVRGNVTGTADAVSIGEPFLLVMFKISVKETIFFRDPMGSEFGRVTTARGNDEICG